MEPIPVSPQLSPLLVGDQIQQLVDRGTNLNAVYAASGDTPLCIAASTGQMKVMQMLLDKGAAPDGAAADGRTPLYDAALNGQAEAIKLLLSRGAAVDGVAVNGSAPLHAAALRGHTDVVAVLLDAGASVNKAAADGITALHCAAFQGYLDVVQLLASRGAAIDRAAADGFTSLHHAGGPCSTWCKQQPVFSLKVHGCCSAHSLTLHVMMLPCCSPCIESTLHLILMRAVTCASQRGKLMTSADCEGVLCSFTCRQPGPHTCGAVPPEPGCSS